MLKYAPWQLGILATLAYLASQPLAHGLGTQVREDWLRMLHMLAQV
jgi:hypothetical protein